MAAIVTSKVPPSRAPSGFLRINRSNPIGKDVLAAFVPRGNKYVEVMTERGPDWIGDPSADSFVADDYDLGLSMISWGISVKRFYSLYGITLPVSMFCRFRMPATLARGGALMFIGTGGTTGNGYGVGFGTSTNYMDGVGSLLMGIYETVAWHNSNVTINPGLRSAGIRVSTTDCTLYLDGVNVYQNASSAPVAATGEVGLNGEYMTEAYYRYPSPIVNYEAVILRGYQPNRTFAALHANSWQIFG